MDFEEFDVVKSEKAKALRRYLRAQKLGTLIRIAEALCALFFFSYYFSDVSLAVDVVSGFVGRQLKVLTAPFSAFMFGNGIVLIIFVLSGGGKDYETGDVGDSEGSSVFRHACMEYESQPKSSPPVGEDSPEGTGTVKPLVFSSSTEEVKEMTAVTDVYVDVNEITGAVKETATESDSRPRDDEIGLPISGNGKSKADGTSVDKGVLGRSNSDVISFKRPSTTGLSRWAIDNGRSTKIHPELVDEQHGTSPWQSSVDDLSNEEFNLKVERYIARKKLLLREEMLAERCTPSLLEIESS